LGDTGFVDTGLIDDSEKNEKCGWGLQQGS
jgi:hypothetical protein